MARKGKTLSKRYKIGKVIGEGEFSEVFEATRIEDGYKCAIKKLYDMDDEDDLDRFKREIQIQTHIKHNNLVPIIDYNLDAKPPWYVMPRALYSLRDHLKNSHGEKSLWIFEQIAHGVAFAHENGIIHRDLKPENILFFVDENKAIYPSLTDFGSCRSISPDNKSITKADYMIGTYEYMAPEQYTTPQEVNLLADIYSLGKLLYEILTNELPYPHIDFQLIPPKFTYIIQKACQNDTQSRYQSVQEMLTDIQTVTQEEDILTIPEKRIRNEIKQLMVERNFSGKKTEPLARMFIKEIKDNAVLTRILPRIPSAILQSLIRNHKSSFETIFEAFDNTLSIQIPYRYCDIVTTFYDRIFKYSKSYDIRLQILKRLTNLASIHNTRTLGNIILKIISNTDNPSLVLAIRDMLKSNQQNIGWIKQYVEDRKIPHAIEEIFNV